MIHGVIAADGEVEIPQFLVTYIADVLFSWLTGRCLTHMHDTSAFEQG